MKVLSVFLSVTLAFSSSIQASHVPGQESAHLISIHELRNEISDRTAVRTRNIHEVQALLRHEAVQTAVGRLFDLEKIAIAVPALDDETLERLARESLRMNEQFKAGQVSSLTWGLIGGLIVFVVLVLVHTVDREEF